MRSLRRISNFRPTSIIMGALITMSMFCTGAAIAQVEIPLLSPGGTVDFTGAEGGVLPLAVVGSTETFGKATAEVMGVSESPAGAAPLSSTAIASDALGRAKTTLSQHVDFNVEPGAQGETVLTAQISGQVDIRGYMLLAGLAVAKSKVRIEILDITPGSEAERIIMSHVLDERKLEGEFAPSVGAGVSVDLGSATAGQIGIGFGAEVAISLVKDVVREQVPFGFTALLQRGHTYRLRLTSENEAKIGIGGGIAESSFYTPYDIPPSLFDPNFWLGTLDMPMLDAGPRVFNFPSRPSPSFNFPLIETSIGDFGGGNVGIGFPRLFPNISSTSDMLTRMNVNNTLSQELTNFLGDFSNRIEEGVALPGVDLRRLEVTLEQDSTEALAEVSDQIEELKEILLRHPPFTRPSPQPRRPKFNFFR